jgi:hypothetical protein
MQEQASLPCFGGVSVEDEPAPLHVLPDDEDTASVNSDEAVTVHGIPANCIAGEVVRDSAGDPLEEATNVEIMDLLDEVSSAAEFLAQLPREEALALLAALRDGKVQKGQEEAMNFIEVLIAHLPDRNAALLALGHGIQHAQSYGGKVSQFLSNRRKFRMAKVRKVGNWEEHFTRGDENTETRRYFYNSATQKTQWEPPPEFDDLDCVIHEEIDGDACE